MQIKLYVTDSQFADALNGRKFMGSTYAETWETANVVEILVDRDDIVGYRFENIYEVKARVTE